LDDYVARGFDLKFWRKTDDPEDDGKGPRAKGWQLAPDDPADYREGMQVGVFTGAQIAPGKFLLDVDFDCGPGIRFASYFLPSTGFGFGRPSKSVGHAFYTTSTAIVMRKFNDVDVNRTTLVELRGTKADGSIGFQTVLPPSKHYESGETVTLTTSGDITHDDTVPGCVTLYAVTCLLGRHWPKNGPDTNRHDTAGYVAGFLCSRGVDPNLVPTIVEIAADLGGDDRVRDRVRYAQDTVAKFRAGIPG
jgi:hypothetical protein